MFSLSCVCGLCLVSENGPEVQGEDKSCGFFCIRVCVCVSLCAQVCVNVRFTLALFLTKVYTEDGLVYVGLLVMVRFRGSGLGYRNKWKIEWTSL